MVSLLFNQFTVGSDSFGGGMAVYNPCRRQLVDEEMATYGLWSEWDEFHLAELAAIAASVRHAPILSNLAAMITRYALCAMACDNMQLRAGRERHSVSDARVELSKQHNSNCRE